MGNDPVNLVDPDGGGVLDFFGPGNPIAGVAHAAAQAAAKSLAQRGAMIAANVATNLVGSAVAKKLFPLPTLNGQSLQNLSFAIPGGAIPAGLSQSAVTLETGTLAGETIIETGVVITDGAAITETGLGFTAMLEGAGVTVAEGTVATIAGPVILVAAGVGILVYCVAMDAHEVGPLPADYYQHLGDIQSLPQVLPKIDPVAPIPPPKPSNDDDDTYIYRGGNPGDANMTPRPQKDTEGDKRGLSTYTTAARAKAMSGKKVATKLSVKALRAAGFIVDYIDDHVSIRPMTQKELEDWAATKENAKEGKGSSIYTKKVQASVRGTE